MAFLSERGFGLWRVIVLLLAFAAGIYAVIRTNYFFLAVALTSGIIAFWRFNDQDVSGFTRLSPHDVWKWCRNHAFCTLASLGVACGGAAAWLGTHEETSLWPSLLWVAALMSILAGAFIQDWQDGGKAPRSSGRLALSEALLLVLMTGIAFALRAWRLDNLTLFMHGDEGEMGLVALRILEGTEPVPPFRTFWLDHPTLFHYFQAASLALFGRDVVGLRMLSAIFGAACVPLLYWLGRCGWGRLAGLVAAWLMTVSHLHVHFSRLGLNNIESVFWMLLLMLLLALAWEQHPKKDLKPFVGAGLVIGISQYFYYGSRLLPVVASPLLLFMWREKRVTSHQLLALALAVIIAFAPLGLHYVKHPAPFLNRMKGVNILQEEAMRHALGQGAVWPKDLPRLLAFQVERNLRFFIHDGDASAFYLRDIPAFDVVTALLFWLGLAAALTRPRRYHEFSTLCWFGLGLLVAGVLTNDPPNAPRLIVIVPSVYLLGGTFVYRTWKLLTSALRKRIEVIGVPVLVAMLGVTSILNAQIYLRNFAQRTGGTEALTIALAFEEKAGKADTYLIGAPLLYVEHGVIRFVARTSHPKNLHKPEELDSPSAPDRGLFVVALPHRLEDLERVKGRFPGGTVIHHYDPVGRLLFVSYEVFPGKDLLVP